MEIIVVINQMAVLFILLALGYFAGKVKILSKDSGKMLSKIIIVISKPCLILHSVLDGSISISGSETAFYMLLTLLAYFIALLIAVPISHLLSIKRKARTLRNAVDVLSSGAVNAKECLPPVSCDSSKAQKNHPPTSVNANLTIVGSPTVSTASDRGIYCYMCVFANVTFMGFPVLYALFGAASAFYVALFNITFTLLNFSLGIFLISGKGLKFNPKTLINPALISALITIPIALIGVTAPGIILDAMGIIGNMTIPSAMLVIGSTLSYIPLKHVFSEWRLYPVALVRLIIVPFITWLVLSRFITNELMLGVLVVLSGMPVAVAGTMLAFEYRGNERIASSGMFLTTLLSGVTIPLIAYLLLT